MNKPPAPVSDRQLYLRLLRYVLPYWHVFLLSLVAMIIVAGTEPAKAALLKPMLDGAFIEKDPQMMVYVPALIVLVFVVSGIAGFVSGASVNWVANKVVMDLRGLMFARLLAFPSSFYDNHNAGGLISKFTFDVTQIKEAATNALTVLVKDTLIIIGLLAWMVYIDWRMSLIALISAPFITVIVAIIRKRLRKMSRKVQDTMADIHHVLGESIEGNRIVKLFGGQQQEQERFHTIINANRRFTMKFANAAVASGPAVQLIAACALAIIVYVAARQAEAGQLTVGEFVSFFGAVAMLLGPLKRLVRINEHIQKGLAACESVFGLLDEATETDTGTRNLQQVKGEIEIEDLQYRYQHHDKTVLENISLHIQPGETIALVGASGSGKTTLANLIPRFYEHKQGRILLDGQDILDVPLMELRANIGLVSQEITLFNDSVRNNIAYGDNRNAGEAEIIAAATAAHAMEFIDKLPDGLDTMIGDKGARLSGGQRQRIALARALLKDAPILILDEATSALDSESERHIQLALEEIRKNRTCLVIAHRLSTIKSADRVLVLEQGRIIESGTHEELMQRNGAYAKFYMTDTDLIKDNGN